MTSPRQILSLLPWWAKALPVIALLLFGIAECRARDASIRETALWTVRWDSLATMKKLSEAQLKAARDSVRLALVEAAKERVEFQVQLARAKVQGAKVIVIHDSVPGVAQKPETTLVADMPIVKACQQSLFADEKAISSCKLYQLAAEKRFLQDSVRIHEALNRPTASRTRDMAIGGGIVAAVIVAVKLLVK